MSEVFTPMPSVGVAALLNRDEALSSMRATVSSFDQALLNALSEGLAASARPRLEQALHQAMDWYAGATLGTGELYFDHAIGMARMAAVLNMDLDVRLACLLFGVADLAEAEQGTAVDWQARVITHFGAGVARLIKGVHKLNRLRLLGRNQPGEAGTDKTQAEILRKMLLAMVEDIRVVVMRLASRNQTLRFMTGHPGPVREQLAHESLDLYAPLANRLGVWQLKWELEDLSFRFLEPDTYKRIARMLDERRIEREQFIKETMERLQAELRAAGIQAEIQGRPKHIYSIWNKMRAKCLEFDEVYDVRALRILVADVKDCYNALGVVHGRWQPVPGEFDDYIATPKGNDYRSLHTAVIAEDGKPFEVQIRTYDMHYHAELGVAAHWRYKESNPTGAASRADSAYDDKIAWLRQLLSWRDEITDSSEWISHFKQAAFDDTIYVLTPQGHVFDLTRGATPLDFAYRLHTDLGHRCRGARIDGQLVALNTPLTSGQRVEIITAKQGGPSRDWLNPELGYLASHRARQKVRQWFAAQDDEALLLQGRTQVMRELQREGQTQRNIEELAHKLGYKTANDLYRVAGRGELSARALQQACSGTTPLREDVSVDSLLTAPGRSPGKGESGGVLVVGVDRLMTQLARCCKPLPPDPISGFITRGRGVSIHRTDCHTLHNIASRYPERIIETAWGLPGQDGRRVYAVDVHIEAREHPGLLRDISDVYSREHVNVTTVKMQSRAGVARLFFTVEVAGQEQLRRLLNLLREQPQVSSVRRG